MDSKNDAELVHLARAGNRDAYGELIRRYQHPIWGLACILLDDRFEIFSKNRRLGNPPCCISLTVSQ